MKTKLGRPEMPEGKANTLIATLRISGDDAKAIDKAVQETKQEKPEWMRDALRKEAKNSPAWVKSKWRKDELIGKVVQFRLTAPDYLVKGVGEFRVLMNPSGELRIDIVVSVPKTPYEMTDYIYHIYQQSADKIEINPDQNKAQFLLLG